MILEVFDFNFKRYGILNTYSMVQYELKSKSVGSFQINCDMSKENIELLQQDRIIWFENDIAGIIQYIQDSNEDEKLMTVKGCLLTEMLNWRCIYPTIDCDNVSINKIVEKYVKDNCCNSDVTKRNFENFEVKEMDSDLEKVSKSKTGDTVEVGIEELLDSINGSMLRFNVGFYPRKEKFIFYLEKGFDRTKGNAEGNKNVLFSQDLKNIIKSEYTLNNQGYRNEAIVAGEGNGTERKQLVVNDGAENRGYNLRELYVDARDVQSKTYEDDVTEKQLLPEQYEERLKQRGLEKLGECSKIENYSGDIRNDADVTFRYGKDYELGDKVDIIDKDLNLKLKAIVTSVTVTQDKNGYTVLPSFGFEQPTLNQKLKKKGVL